MIDFEELKKHHESDFPTFKLTEAFYKGTCALESYISTVVINILNNQIKLSKKEKAVIETYYRMYSWLQTVISLNSLKHFQGVASSCRSIYELLLDENLLIYDLIENGLEKHLAFTKIERYRVAKQIVDYKSKYPESEIEDERQIELISIPGKQLEIENLIVKYWGMDKNSKPKKISHWSEMNVRYRAEKIDRAQNNGCFKYEELYVSSYPMLSWYIHSGSAGIENLKTESFETIIGNSHSIIQNCFLEATRIIGIFMHINQAMENFFRVIDMLKLEPGKFLIDEQIRLLKEAEKK